MSLGGKARSLEQAALRTPEASAQPVERRDEALTQMGARIRAHVRHVLQQAAPRASIERD